MKIKAEKSIPFALLASVSMSGCAVQEAYDRKESIESEIKSIDEDKVMRSVMSESSSTAVMKKGNFFAGHSYKLSEKERLPKFFYEKFSINQINPLSLQDIISVIVREAKVRIQLTDDALSYISNISDNAVDDGVESSNPDDRQVFNAARVTSDGAKLPGAGLKLSVRDSDSLYDLLESITTKSNLFWKYENGQIVIYRTETKTFFVAVDPGKGGVSGRVNAGTTAGGGKSSAGSSHSTEYQFNPDNYWNYIDKALAKLVSKEGKFSANQVMGIVTVTDTPDRVAHVENYIKEVNALANKRIAVAVEVYDIELTDTTKHGFDFDLNKLENSGVIMNTNMGSFTPTDLFSFTIKDGVLGGVTAVMDMLAEAGSVSEVTQHTVNTTNGISVPIQVIEEHSYVKEQTFRESVDSDRLEPDIETALINEGISMSILPRIIGKNRMTVNFAADIGKIIKMDTHKVGNGGMVQLPRRSTKNFLQRLPLNSGETVMLVGFERTVKSVEQSGLPSSEAWMAGGKMNSSEKKIYSVVLVTPYILSNK